MHWLLLLVSVHATHALLHIINGLLQTAGTNLGHLNPCPPTYRLKYRPRSSFDVACLGDSNPDDIKPAYNNQPRKPNINTPNNPISYALPQTEKLNQNVRGTQETERTVLVAEMQDIIHKVMSQMKIGTQHRPTIGDELFNYGGKIQMHDKVQDQREETFTFSHLMKMDKNQQSKQKFFKTIPTGNSDKGIRFQTDKQLTIDPVISAMMRNVDSYQKHSEDKLIGRPENHFKFDPFSTVMLYHGIVQ